MAAAEPDRLDSILDMSRDQLISLPPSQQIKQILDNGQSVTDVFPKPSSPTDPLFALRLTEEGKYSISKKRDSAAILQSIKDSYPIPFTNITVMDATGNNGGDTIRFGLDPSIVKVVSVEINPENYKVLQHNVKLYDSLTTKVDVIHGDMEAKLKEGIECDILYVDPPWGGYDRVKDAAMSKRPITLHLSGSVHDYSPDNEVFTIIQRSPQPWKMCCVKIPGTIDSTILMTTLNRLFPEYKKDIFMISNPDLNKFHKFRSGIQLVIITKRMGGMKKRIRKTRIYKTKRRRNKTHKKL